MQPQVRRHGAFSEYETDERCAILEISNHADDPDVSIARARVGPGVTTAWHRLVGTVERYLIIAGTGLVEIGEQAPQRVQPGDVVLIPAASRQRIRNDADTDLVFYAICSPRFRAGCYEALE